MTSSSLLECVVMEPGRPADSAVIWLHGLGASGFDFPPIVGELGLPDDHGIRFIFPHAPQIPVTVNGGMVMPAWYDILAMDFDRQVDELGVRNSAKHLVRLIERERSRDIEAERIVLAGFSQGGAIALHQALRHPDRLAGLILLSTYIAADCDLEEERTAINQEIPIFQAHGTRDPMVTHGMGLKAKARLEDLGYGVQWEEYTMEHQVVAEEINALGIWLREALAPEAN